MGRWRDDEEKIEESDGGRAYLVVIEIGIRRAGSGVVLGDTTSRWLLLLVMRTGTRGEGFTGMDGVQVGLMRRVP